MQLMLINLFSKETSGLTKKAQEKSQYKQTREGFCLCFRNTQDGEDKKCNDVDTVSSENGDPEC